jgi:fucose 4-O-acetylase-like acetyltransferase
MRNNTLDIMRGMGIILVVLSHAIVKHDPTVIGSYSNGVFNVISSFFMPMFLLISGYVVYDKIGNWNWTKSHIIKWLIPIAIFMLLYFVFNMMFPNLIHFYGLTQYTFTQYLYRMLVYGFSNSILWYIWTFILCYLVCYGLEKSRIRYPKIPLIAQVAILLVALNVLPFTLFGVLVLKWYGIFFFIGYTLHHYKIDNRLAYFSLALFPIGIIATDMIRGMSNNYGNFGQTVIQLAVINGQTLLVLKIFAMAMLGTGFIYSLAKLIKWQPFVKLFTYLGSISIGIYLLHVMFVGITKNYWISTLLAILISVGLLEGLRRVSWVNFALFGGEYKKKLEAGHG